MLKNARKIIYLLARGTLLFLSFKGPTHGKSDDTYIS